MKRRSAKRRSARRAIAGKAIAVVCILAVLLALALVVGDNDYHATVVGWAPFAAAVFAIACAYAYVRAMAATLSLSEELDYSDCGRGQEVPFTVRIANKLPLVCFRIEASFFISDLFGNVAHESETVIALGPRERRELRFAATFDHIGTYTAGLRQVVVSDFLGLFTRTLRTGASHEVDVTPQLQLLEQVSFQDSATVETSKAAKAVVADSMDYSHVREYVMGDPLKTIHWKLSARAQGYLTRLYEVYREPGVAVIMDFYAPAKEALALMGMFDAVVESAFSIAEFTKGKGMDTEVFFTDKDGEKRKAVSWDEDDMPQLIADMPRMSNDEVNAPDALALLRDQVMSPSGQSMIIVCTASMNPELISAVVDAKARHRAPLMIAVVPMDLDGRALDDYCKPLAELDAANVPCVTIARSEELGVRLR